MPAASETPERRGIRGLFAKRAASHNNALDIAKQATAQASHGSNAPAAPPGSSNGSNHQVPAPDRDRLHTSNTWASHRRDSSILSLTSSVTEGVKRSVSLRSHRTNLSSASSFGGGLKGTGRSTSGGQVFTPFSSQASPVEAADVQSVTASPKKERDTSTLVQQVNSRDLKDKDDTPALKRKISLAKGLSHKFRSTEALPTLNAQALAQINLDGVKDRSPKDGVYQNPLSPIPSAGVSMLVGTTGGHAPPNMSRKVSAAASERPGAALHTQSSFSRDISSSHGNYPNGAPLSHAPSAPTFVGGGGPLNPNTIYTQIQETSAKRMATIDYMRRLHDGDLFYFSTLHYSPAGLSTMPSLHPHKLGRRATNYFILGYSLPALLDMNCSNPLEYLKTLTSLLVEFETFQNLSGFDSSGNVTRTGRVGAMFKSGMGLNRGKGGRRSSTAIDTVGSLDPRQADLLGMPTSARNTGGDNGSPHDLSSPINPTGHEYTYLLTPHLPFEPDFSTTLGTLCDTLIDTYGKLLDLVNGPDSCTPIVGSEFAKADKAIRKILVANVVREFEDTTRAGIKGEIAGLGKLTLAGLM
ncbi:hypothetical protein DOTSEDRAFT_72080 [Dothistroma septosporum NZE10]|uniref:Uncharacterized protein n=1 Tax=Dothistroma septosporum (strain NZE10 / CBS 128990) TaxID=675120 RepID=N1PQ26_DOTSN|nr:hypothetical protein DOTSEDRAFT_72080 [Dothistroma septosporum NZE10]